MKRNLKRILALVLCLLTVVQLSVPAYSMYFIDYFYPSSSPKNILNENTSNWMTTTTSFMYEYSGKYYVVNIATDKDNDSYYVENIVSHLTVTKYTSDFNYLEENGIKIELPLWGGFYSGKNYNYMIFGQTNFEESQTKEVYRIVKYDKNFNRISSVSINGKQCQTIVPFNYSSSSISENATGSELTVHTARQRFKSEKDGLNHQSQFTIIIDTKTMTVKNELQEFQNNHVSHSFNQFVQYDGDSPVLVDHGDAYPRCILLSKRLANGKYSELSLFDIPGKVGANCTGVNVGGFEISSNNYIVSINSIDHSKVTSYDSYNMYGLDKDERNAVLLISAKNNTDPSKVKRVYLTNYVNKGMSATAPYLVKINNNKFVVIWKEFLISKEGTDSNGEPRYIYNENAVRFLIIDENGNKLSNVQTLIAPCNLSDCQPIYHNGKIIWYYDTGKLDRRICIINIDSNSNHDHVIQHFPSTASSCSKEGHTEYYYCVTCNRYFGDSAGKTALTQEKTIIKKLPHTPGDWKIVLRATATEEGKRIKYCTVCNAVAVEETIPKLATLGDANLDGQVNSTDALLALQHSVKKVTLTGQKLTNADVNKDNKVNTTDALKILQYSVGKINKF